MFSIPQERRPRFADGIPDWDFSGHEVSTKVDESVGKVLLITYQSIPDAGVEIASGTALPQVSAAVNQRPPPIRLAPPP